MNNWVESTFGTEMTYCPDSTVTLSFQQQLTIIILRNTGEHRVSTEIGQYTVPRLIIMNNAETAMFQESNSTDLKC
jgi:hypothetical protein